VTPKDDDDIGFDIDSEICTTTVVDHEIQLPVPEPDLVSKWAGFKIVGDNRILDPASKGLITKLYHCTISM